MKTSFEVHTPISTSNSTPHWFRSLFRHPTSLQIRDVTALSCMMSLWFVSVLKLYDAIMIRVRVQPAYKLLLSGSYSIMIDTYTTSNFNIRYQ